MDIGQAIKTLRQEHNITQTQLATKCCVSTYTVSKWELGKAYPPKGSIERICKAFDIPNAYLLLASIDEEDIPEEKRVLYRALVEPLRKELLSKQEQS